MVEGQPDVIVVRSDQLKRTNILLLRRSIKEKQTHPGLIFVGFDPFLLIEASDANLNLLGKL
jgi:hypothetical protein